MCSSNAQFDRSADQSFMHDKQRVNRTSHLPPSFFISLTSGKEGAPWDLSGDIQVILKPSMY